MDILRIMICGSVDDGKSTLVGKLFQDFGHIKDDHLLAIDRASKKQGLSTHNLALFTDGLKSEIEQGITIDVAYRYLNLPSLRIIVADAPGHLQYTRNMVTACSQVDAVILMMDASAGLKEQTLRHLSVAQWMNVPRILLCVNKMDLVNFSESVFLERVKETQTALGLTQEQPLLDAIPFCAVEGYGIRNFENTPLSWFQGNSLLDWLKSGTKNLNHSSDPLRISVQGSMIPKNSTSVSERRWFGVIHSGHLHQGQTLAFIDPSGSQTEFKISNLWIKQDEAKTALPGDAIVFQIDQSIDLTSGELLFGIDHQLKISKKWKTEIFNLSAKKLIKGDRFLLRTSLSEQLIILEDLEKEIIPNEKGTAVLRLQKTLAADLKSKLNHTETSTFIFINPTDGNTVAAGFFIDID